MRRYSNSVLRLFIVIQFSLFIIFFASIVWALDKDIPLPQDAVQKLNENSSVGPINASVSSYITSWSIDKITNFYKKEMASNGWTDQSNMRFLKGDRFVTIVPSQHKFKDNQTLFNIVQGVMPTKEAIMAGQKAQPDKLNFMPVYPASTQLLLWDTPTGIVAGYKTQSKIQEVIFFYKAGMLNYGWTLSEETPIKESSLGSNCPECEKKKKAGLPPNASVPNIQGSMLTVKLAFRKSAVETCTIDILETKAKMKPQQMTPSAQEALALGKTSPADLGNQTQIMVTYGIFQRV